VNCWVTSEITHHSAKRTQHSVPETLTGAPSQVNRKKSSNFTIPRLPNPLQGLLSSTPVNSPFLPPSLWVVFPLLAFRDCTFCWPSHSKKWATQTGKELESTDLECKNDT
jgi:hypothetical protein